METRFYSGQDVLFQLGDTIRLFDSRGDAYSITGIVDAIEQSEIRLSIADGLQSSMTLSANRIREAIANGTYTLQLLAQSTADERVLAGSSDSQDLAECSLPALQSRASQLASSAYIHADAARIIDALLQRLA